jgi:hypothetical protein
LETVTNALRQLGATGITVDVLGSVGREYAYAVGYEAEGSDGDDWVFTMPPRVTEFTVIDDDATVTETAEYGFIDKEAA